MRKLLCLSFPTLFILAVFLILSLMQCFQAYSLMREIEDINESVAALKDNQQTMREQLQRVEEYHPIPASIFEPLDIPLGPELQEHAVSEARRIGIEPSILFALMYRESRFQTDAWRIDTNGYESVGVCQINGIALPFLIERGIDPSSPYGNITAACELIGHYLKRFSIKEALAAYGVGESAMLRGGGLEAAEELIESAQIFK